MTHECGGTILTAGSGEMRHDYCDRCHAYAYDGRPVPDGADKAANLRAWDRGDNASPEAASIPQTLEEA